MLCTDSYNVVSENDSLESATARVVIFPYRPAMWELLAITSSAGVSLALFMLDDGKAVFLRAERTFDGCGNVDSGLIVSGDV